jgi:hypothetical protein
MPCSRVTTCGVGPNPALSPARSARPGRVPAGCCLPLGMSHGISTRRSDSCLLRSYGPVRHRCGADLFTNSTPRVVPPRSCCREPAQDRHATGDRLAQASDRVTAECARRAQQKARSCPARPPGTASLTSVRPAALTWPPSVRPAGPVWPVGTASRRRSCPSCRTSPPGLRPLRSRARPSWSPSGLPRATG